MDVTIIVCSLNAVDEHVHKINSYNNKGLSYEILVCSDVTTRGLDNVRYIEDPKTSVKAFNTCYKQSSGDFILTFPGGVTPRGDMFNMIDHLNGLKYKVSAFSGEGGSPCWIPDWAVYMYNLDTCRRCGSINNRSQILRYMYNLDNRSQILRFPAFHRDFIETNLEGVIFNESFCHHYVDNWLGAFCGKHFGSTENSNLRIVTERNHKSVTKYDEHDKKIFQQLLKNNGSYNYKTSVE
tara:strand:- start:2638 stop:3351 length:714 start_codon:yes stop_codon:yes gene_type:complete